MSKDPAILFYTSDFLTGTLTMTDSQKGKYITLLCLQHQQGYLTEEDMLNICKTYDDKVYRKFIKENDGFYYNERMKIESNKRKKYSESRSNNRKNICKTYDTSYDKHMENENINRDINISSLLNVPFDFFWNFYDKKVDRKKCEPKWNKLTDHEREIAIHHVQDYVQATPDKKYRRDPETYLNNKSWENEIIKHGTDKKTNGATNQQLAELLAVKLGSDSPINR